MMKYLDMGAFYGGARKEYRYSLTRVMDRGLRTVSFVGLNPSTATEEVDDPTIRRCVGFALAWDFDRLFMLNLHGWRSTDPRGMKLTPDPVGKDNFFMVKTLCHASELVVCAWGANELHERAHVIADWVKRLPHARHLGLTKRGEPRHPLYLPKNSELQRFAL